MRWENLFDDFEAQLAAHEALERDAEVTDRIRRERALLGLHERLLAHRGQAIEVRTAGGLAVAGRVADVGAEWVLVGDPAPSTLIPYAAIVGIRGVGSRAGQPGAVAKRFGFAMALRVIARDRATVDVVDAYGSQLTGTIDSVGSDVFDLAAHPGDVPRRTANVIDRWVLPMASVVAVRRHG